MFRRNNKRGDLLVHVTVVVPKKLSRKAKKVAEELGKEIGDDVSRNAPRSSSSVRTGFALRKSFCVGNKLTAPLS